MTLPANRYKLLPLRGLKANLDAALAEILEGEMCYATDEDRYYQKEGGVLVGVGGAGGGVEEAPVDGRFYVRSNASWVNQDASLLQRYVLDADGGDFDTGISLGAYVDLDPGNFDTGLCIGEDLFVSGGVFD